MKPTLAFLLALLVSLGWGKTYVVTGNPAQVEAILREGLADAVGSLDPPVFVQPPGYPVLKNPIVVECAGKSINFEWRSEWFGVMYDGPPGTVGITISNAKMGEIRGFSGRVKNSRTTLLAITGASTSNVTLRGCSFGITGPETVDSIGLLIGDLGSNDVNDINVYNCRFTGNATGTTLKERIFSAVRLRNVGIQMTGRNNKANYVRSCQFSALGTAIDQRGNAAWGFINEGGDGSTYDNVVASYCGVILTVGGWQTVTIRGGRVEASAKLLSVGPDKRHAGGVGMVTVDTVTFALPLAGWNRELGISDVDGVLVTLNSDGQADVKLSVYGWREESGPVRETTSRNGVATPASKIDVKPP